ncbi:hypothetical protein B0T19DRAFT_100148 [Cercophora scortea]|uniref:Uncharacterized protein n=1 Tax=Cercophora scortea TaxID=314031 RepID=A0AAE0IW22_9PEZI|nr:hypothetical protein B0T19DRAFT_100148 [Cercophora scortea]
MPPWIPLWGFGLCCTKTFPASHCMDAHALFGPQERPILHYRTDIYLKLTSRALLKAVVGWKPQRRARFGACEFSHRAIVAFNGVYLGRYADMHIPNAASTPQLVTDKLTGVMEFDVLALLMHFFVRHQQVSHKSRCCGRHNKTYVSMEFVMAFIETFHQPSRLSAAFRWHIKPEVGPPTTHQEIVLQFHLRYLRPSQSRLPLTHLSEDEQGVVLHRLQAFITNGLKQIFSLEHGLSLCLMLTITPDFPYTILAVADQTPHRATEILVFPERATWEPNQILPCEGYPGLVGIAQFLASFSLQVERWDKGWTDTLEQIDEAFRRQVSLSISSLKTAAFGLLVINGTLLTATHQITNSLDADQCESVMFDESFKLSKIYFTTIQVLNVASDWIEKSIGEWESLARRWVRETRVDEVSDQKGLGLVGEGWGHVTANFKAKADGHLDRIRQKREEVKALRDGLFNATSLREATKGMALNRAIYVFTIVTVIFTPISFMAVRLLPPRHPTERAELTAALDILGVATLEHL